MTEATKKRSRVLTVLAVVAALGASVLYASGAMAGEDEPPTVTEETLQLAGDALAQQLGLTLEESFQDALPCAYFVEVAEESGYCIESVSTSNEELRAVAARLQGKALPSEAVVHFMSLMDELQVTSPDDPNREALLQEIQTAQDELRSGEG